MTWLLLILILSTLAVLCVGMAIYLQIRRHMRAQDSGSNEAPGVDREPSKL